MARKVLSLERQEQFAVLLEQGSVVSGRLRNAQPLLDWVPKALPFDDSRNAADLGDLLVKPVEVQFLLTQHGNLHGVDALLVQHLLAWSRATRTGVVTSISSVKKVFLLGGL